MTGAVPPNVREFLREVAQKQHAGVPTFAVVAAEAAAEAGIQEGDTVIYARSGGQAAGNGLAVAVSDGGRIIFGRAVSDGARIRIGGAAYPRHMVRGVIVAACRKLETK